MCTASQQKLQNRIDSNAIEFWTHVRWQSVLEIPLPCVSDPWHSATTVDRPVCECAVCTHKLLCNEQFQCSKNKLNKTKQKKTQRRTKVECTRIHIYCIHSVDSISAHIRIALVLRHRVMFLKKAGRINDEIAGSLELMSTAEEKTQKKKKKRKK